jgi:hypothetical protein
MTSVNVTTTQNTVTVSDDGGSVTVNADDSGTVTVTTTGIAQTTYDALVARVAALEGVNYLVLEDND